MMPMFRNTILLLQQAIFLLLISVAVVANEYHTIKFSGNIMLDYDSFDENFLEKSDQGDSASEIRRLRLGLESDFYTNWRAKLQLDVTDGIETKDAYVHYSGWGFAEFTVGKQKEPFGLERLMSSKNLFMIERSMISNALSPDRNYGFKASGDQHSVNWQLGYFQTDNHENSNAITGRLTWAPWVEDKNFVHLGTAFSERNLRGATFRINEQMEVHSADSLVEGFSIEADTASLNSLEFIWQQNGLTNMAEWQQTIVRSDDGSEYKYDGGYYQLGYLFSGKNRKYKNGILGGVNTKDDWELTLRYSQLALHEENSKAKTLSMGLHYYFDKNLKFMGEIIHADYVDDGKDQGSGNAISLRMQYEF